MKSRVDDVAHNREQTGVQCARAPALSKSAGPRTAGLFVKLNAAPGPASPSRQPYCSRIPFDLV